jgi:hypothetical protein
MIYDNGASLRRLFHGLCGLFDFDVEEAEDPADPADFCIGSRPRVYVVILPEPEDRQVEIASLLHYGNKVLILDRHDLDLFRRCADRFSAALAIETWLRDGTHASAERERMGLGR